MLAAVNPSHLAINHEIFHHDHALLLSPDDIQEILFALDSNDDEPSSGSDGFKYQSVDNERKKRRKVSNRESARRSRWRKKRHLENLTKESTRLGIVNQELKNRVVCVANRVQGLMRENERLLLEYGALWAQLKGVYAAMQLHNCNLHNELPTY